jgi:hypothetical protein
VSETSAGATRARAEEAYGRLPLQFEANLGQAPAAVKFTSRASGLSLYLLDSAEAVMQLRNSACGLRNRKFIDPSANSKNPQSAIRNPQWCG